LRAGTFCWVDLTTTVAEGAKAFYGDLFGWEFRDDEIPSGVYTGHCDAVGAIYQQNEHLPHWNNYVSVTSADETSARAKRLGARVLEEPFDVAGFGRLAVLADPRRRDALRLGAAVAHRRGTGQRCWLYGLERAPDPRLRGGGRFLWRALRLGNQYDRGRSRTQATRTVVSCR
jgi:predicted enzyme related to lactoylglutathione lyase